MRRLILLVLAAVTTFLPAQTPVFSVDGKTICSTNNVLSLCNAAASGLPSSWSVGPDGGFVGPSVTVQKVTINGGVNYSAGNYLGTFDANGNQGWTLYTPTPGPEGPQGPAGPQGPPGTGSGGSSCTALAPVAMPASTTTIPAGGSTTAVTVTSALITATSHITVTPTFTTAAQYPVNFEPFVHILRAGAIGVYARFMPYGSPQSFAGGTVNVEVCP